VALNPDDMLKRMSELLGQPAVGNKHDTDHRAIASRLLHTTTADS
jgi:hypothetical protein